MTTLAESMIIVGVDNHPPMLEKSFYDPWKSRLFTGLQLNESMTISHLFYADDAVFIEEWSESNMENIVIMLKCFFLASGLKINIQKSHIMGVGVADGLIHQAASLIGCAIMKTPFRYLGVLVGNNSLRCSAWSDTIHKLRSRLSKWKVKTLSVGGRLTLLKSVLGASPIYNLSIYKAPITVLKEMERIRSNFFKGTDNNDRKISWVSWDKVLASKKVGGLGVSSYYALNRALILKWVWRFVSQDGSLWFRVIQALHGTSLESHQVQITLLWSSILCEMHVLVLKEKEKEITVASKLRLPSVDSSFRRQIRDGYVGGGSLIIRTCLHLQIGMFGSPLSDVRLSPKSCWKEYFLWRGGVNASFLDEYMQISEKSSRKALDHFCQAVMEIYGPEYLRKPTVTDVEKLYRHHEEKHGFSGMLGSLDSVSSQDLWIWHAFFGVTGSNNDINVLYQSPLFNDLKTGRAPEIPFVANGITYPSGYYLVDGIYPELATLVKTILEPADEDHKRILYKKKQESAKKDVKRAFGGLKKKWAILVNPT
nr:RNA-directed DNA polymerase, eukaryota [Tanacetum cinerariifolium]